MPTPVYLTGWEHGLFTVNGGGIAQTANGTPTVDNTGRPPGTYCAKVTHSGTATNWVPFVGAASQTILVFTIQLRKSANPTNIIAYAVSVNVTAGNQPRFGFQTTGEIYASIGNPIAGGSGTQTIVGPSVANDTWVRIDARVNVANNPNTIEWFVNGVPQTTVSVAQAATTFTTTPFTLGSSIATQTMVYSWDDFVVSNTASDFPFGETDVLSLLPGADGVHNAGSGVFINGDTATTPNFDNTTTNAYTFVDDAPPWTTTRDTSDNISAETHTAGAYMEIAPLPAYAGKPKAHGVRALLAYSSPTALANLAATAVRNSNGDQVDIFGTINGTGADYSETTNFFKGAIVTAPPEGWDRNEIEAIRWRCGLPSGAGDVSPRPTWQMLMLEIAYSTVSEAAEGMPRMYAFSELPLTMLMLGRQDFNTTPTATFQTFLQDLVANVTTTATIQRNVGKVLTATVTTTATITKTVLKNLSATATTTATIAKTVLKSLSATVSSTASIVTQKVKLVALTATVTTTATMSRLVLKPLSATVTTTATMVRKTLKNLSATATSTASIAMIKVKLVALTATVTTTATMSRVILKPLSATATTTATISKTVLKRMTATATSTATIVMQKTKVVALTATVTTTATIRKATLKTLSATATTSATIQKTVGKTLSATVSITASLVTQIGGSFQRVFAMFSGGSPSSSASSSPAEGSLENAPEGAVDSSPMEASLENDPESEVS